MKPQVGDLRTVTQMFDGEQWVLCLQSMPPRELSDDEIEHITKKWFDCHPEEKLTTRFPIPLYSVVNLCKAILKKASEK